MAVLKDIRVIEITQGLSGPYCGMILGDMGAEIIKIELPEVGDDSRAFGPFINEESAYFISVNRNKKSVTLDLRQHEGVEVLKKLVKLADIVIDNYKPDVLNHLGVGYEHLKLINEKIIYCGITGYGQEGPYKKKPAYDAVIQAMSGMMSVTGEATGNPIRVGAPIGDMTAALYGVIGILGALHQREKTQQGKMVDISILDSQVSILENPIMRYSLTGEKPEKMGNQHPSITPFETFMTRDGEIMVAIGNNRMWVSFCKLINKHEWINDYRFSTNKKRLHYYHELKPLLNKVFIQNTTREWQILLDENKIANSPIHSIDELLDNEQVKYRKTIVDTPYMNGTNILKVPNTPIRYKEDPLDINVKAPKLGQDTNTVLKDYLNFNQKQIEELIKKGII